MPPIKKDQDDGSSFGDEVRSRVLYGGRGPSSKGTSDSQLPPELEGDERLKNIEPRMVELIVNEVRAHVYHIHTALIVLHILVYSVSVASAAQVGIWGGMGNGEMVIYWIVSR